MNTKNIVGKLVIALALTFTIPPLVFFYIWEDLSKRASTLLLSSTILLSGLGIYLVWDIIQSIRIVFKGISDITREESKSNSGKQVDEFKLLGNSIEMISEKIVENMEDLQHSASLIEQTEEDLKLAQLYNDNVMDAMADALVVIDTGNRIKRMNASAKDLLDFHVDNYLGQTIDLFFEKEDAMHFVKDQAITGKRMTLVGSKGVRIPVDLNVRPMNDPKGHYIGHVLVARDLRKTLGVISKLKERNKALEGAAHQRAVNIERVHEEMKAKDAQVLLQEKMASIAILTTGISHEIKNPLAHMRKNLEVLQKDFKDILSYKELMEYEIKRLSEEDDRHRRIQDMEEFRNAREAMEIDNHLSHFKELLDEAGMGLSQISDIIDDLRRFSNDGNQEMRVVNLNEEMQGAINIVRHDLNENIKMIRKFEPLPPVRCYANQLNQVFMNILINASQALGGAGTITISTFASEGRVSVLIQDTGSGIAPEYMKKIFKPFFTTKALGKGTGLGLYLSDDIIQRHMGTLSVESRLGDGTTFMIKLPAFVVKLHPTSPFEVGTSLPAA